MDRPVGIGHSSLSKNIEHPRFHVSKAKPHPKAALTSLGDMALLHTSQIPLLE
jgi:hypothetical protein